MSKDPNDFTAEQFTVDQGKSTRNLSKFDKVSYTKLSSYEACKRKFFLRYKKKLREEMTLAMDRGSFAHTVLEKFFEPKASPFRDFMFLEVEMESRMLRIFDAELPKTELLKHDEATIEHTRDGLLFYLQIMYREIAPLVAKYGCYPAWAMVRPKFNELPIETDEMMGFIDTVKVDKVSGDVTLTDYKTSKLFKQPYKAEYHDQLNFYALMYFYATGQMPDYGTIEYILFGKSFTVKFTEEDLTNIKDRVEAMLSYRDEHFEDEGFENWETNPDYQFCNWCSYRTMINPVTNEPYCTGADRGEA